MTSALCMCQNVIPLFTTGQFVALIAAILFLFVSGFISGSEISFFSLSPNHDEEIEQSDHKR